jgi:DNA-binding transcriptional LysR family regulator
MPGAIIAETDNAEQRSDSVDIALLRTFLEVARLRHFGKAAERLYVTQSAVSARIRQLEELLGVELFDRKRNDIQLTAAGHRLSRHAEGIVNTWQRARQEITMSPGIEAVRSLGFASDLWGILVRDWVLRIEQVWPGLGLQLEVHAQALLPEKVATGQLDLALLFEPTTIAGLEVREVARVPLVLVSTRRQIPLAEVPKHGYVLVDWGVSFALMHARQFADWPAATVRVANGAMALDLLHRRGGCAYLARQLVEPGLSAGSLFLVEGAPEINRAAFATFRADRDADDGLERLLALF